MPSKVSDGEKFAYLAVPRLSVAADEFINADDGVLVKRVGPVEVWATTELPTAQIDDFWKEKLGENTTDDIASASLYLVAKRTSQIDALGVDDAQSEELRSKVVELFKSLILASKLDTRGQSWLTSGAKSPDTTNIHRTFVPYPSLYQVPGVHCPDITSADIGRAASIADAAMVCRSRDFARLNKAYRSFWLTTRSRFFDERLHQAARCIEGLILPEKAHTKRMFRSRTELFVGIREHKLMGNLYSLRSAIEHLNDPLEVIEEVKEDEKYLYMYTTMVIGEAVARYCISHILLSSEVLSHFRNDASIKAFWQLTEEERERIWDSEYDVNDALEGFEADSVVLEELKKVF